MNTMLKRTLPLLLTALLLLGGCGSAQDKTEGGGEAPTPTPVIVDGVVIDSAEISEASFAADKAAYLQGHLDREKWSNMLDEELFDRFLSFYNEHITRCML